MHFLNYRLGKLEVALMLKEINKENNYNIILREINGTFHASIPELVISSSDKSLLIAFEKLEQQKEQALFNMAEAGLLEYVPKPAESSTPLEKVGYSKGISAELTLFSCKVAIVLLVVTLSTGLVYNIGSRSITSLAYKIKTYPSKIANLPDSKILDITERAKNLSSKLRPILNELVILGDKENSKIEK